ncbi:Rho guanine nucleotide exchange factor [Marasmius sp. AFHP31]|nr:Rho guanine nucleotide exchange factor [Marasmius sp. AFHP31]
MNYDEEAKRLREVISDERRRKEVLRTTGEEAQEWLDLMQLLLERPGAHQDFRAFIFKMMLRLSRSTGLHPKCLTIHDVEISSPHPIGGGAFGDVYKGKRGESIVCLKVLRVFEPDEVEQAIKDYMREAIVWRQLDHPNLLPFLGIYYMDDTMRRLCLVSPWMERGNLVHFMKETPELVQPKSLANDVARGLSYLHDMKIVHGDLKGPNILITPDLKARIGDFGLSRVTDTQRLFTFQTNYSGGTMRWLAPELLRPGPNCVSSRESDVYAYACVCYEIFTGRLPFHELSDYAVVAAVLIQGQRPSRPTNPREIQDSVWDMMTSCWHEEPTSRPAMAKIIEGFQRMDPGVLLSLSQVGKHLGDSRPGLPRVPQIWVSNVVQDEVDEEPHTLLADLYTPWRAPEPPLASSSPYGLPEVNGPLVRPRKYGGLGSSSASAQAQAYPGPTGSVSANPTVSSMDVRELRPTFSPRIIRTPDHYRTDGILGRNNSLATPFPLLGDGDRTTPDTEINTLASMLASILDDKPSRTAIPGPTTVGDASRNGVPSFSQQAAQKRHVSEDGIPSFGQRAEQHSKSSTSRSRSTSASSQSHQQGHGYLSFELDATSSDDETGSTLLRCPRSHKRELSPPKNPYPSRLRNQSVGTHARPSNRPTINNPYDWRTPDHTGQGHTPHAYRSLVRQGYWNKRGDHLTPSGYVVYAPPDRAYPHELASYPPQDFRNETGMIASWTDRPTLPESMPTRNGPPLRPYEQFIIYMQPPT